MSLAKINTNAVVTQQNKKNFYKKLIEYPQYWSNKNN